MALVTKYPTILDVSKRLGEDGKIESKIIELLWANNQILWDLPLFEGNSNVGNLTTRRSSLPTVDFRKFNKGITPGKSSTDQIFHSSGFLDALAQVDRDIVELNGNTQAFLQSENDAFLEAMNQKMASTIFYGDTKTTPEGFDGLGTFYTTSSTTKTNPGYNIIKAGGSGSDNWSMWLCCWGPQTGYGFYPKGTNGGIYQNYHGIIPAYDSSNNPFFAHTTEYKWHLGISIRDWRYFVRIANIDASDLATFKDSTDTSPNLLKMMNTAKWRIPNIENQNAVWYAPSEVISILEEMIDYRPGLHISRAEVLNQVTGFTNSEIRYKGIPIRRCDSLVNEATAIS